MASYVIFSRVEIRENSSAFFYIKFLFHKNVNLALKRHLILSTNIILLAIKIKIFIWIINFFIWKLNIFIQ